MTRYDPWLAEALLLVHFDANALQHLTPAEFMYLATLDDDDMPPEPPDDADAEISSDDLKERLIRRIEQAQRQPGDRRGA